MKKWDSHKIDFIYNSNRIEEIDYPKSIYGKDTLISEVKGHSDAYDYMVANSNKKLTEKHILMMHKLLTNELLPTETSGHYRKCRVFIGGREGTLAIAIKQEMQQLIKLCNKARSEKQCWNCHDEFEIIHPFVDGNGRTGRLILNWLRLHNGYPIFVVKHTDDMRWDYYRKIEEYRQQKQLLLYAMEMDIISNQGVDKKRKK